MREKFRSINEFVCSFYSLVSMATSFRFLAIRKPVFYRADVSKRKVITVVCFVWAFIVVSTSIYVTLGRSPDLRIGVLCVWVNVLKDLVCTTE